MRMMISVAVAIPVALLVLVGAGTAEAYVRRTNGSGVPLWWRPRTMSIAGYEQGFDPDLTADQIARAMAEAALQWTTGNPDLDACTDLALPVTTHDLTEAPPAIARDGVNTIAARQSWEYEHLALAQTSLFFVKSTGEILEADLEVNAQDFTWTDVSSNRGRGLQDLQNALTHELGHFIGLDHPCYLADPSSDETDNAGQPVPSCNDVAFDSPIRAATMFPSADAGDTSKRTLSPDDELAVCDIYPRGMATAGSSGSGPPDDSTGCRCAIDAGPSPWTPSGHLGAGALALGVGGLVLRGRRRG
jgi:hypothetical protein